MSDAAFDPVTPATVSKDEREELTHRHFRATRTVFRAPDGAVSEIDTEPFCPQCGQMWGEHGCPTVRIVAALYQAERKAREAGEREWAMRKELAALAVRGEWWKDQSVQTMNGSFTIAGAALVTGGMSMVRGVVAEMLHKIEREAFPPRPAKSAVENLERRGER